VLVAVLTQIAKDVVKADGGKANYVGWLDWMSRVVSCTSPGKVWSWLIFPEFQLQPLSPAY
jgi:hypothetical protein